MKVVILCGGQGTRIRDVSEDLPKPMIPIAGFPILWHIMKYYASWGHKEFILCLGYKSNVIKDYFINYEQNKTDLTLILGQRKMPIYHSEHNEVDWKITLAETGVLANTGSRVKQIEKYIGEDDEFMLTYGDGVSDVNLERLVNFHKSHGKLMTITGVYPPSRFGELCHDCDGRVMEFREKPQAVGGRISGGYFVCNRGIFKYLEGHEGEVFETSAIPRMVFDNQVMMYTHDGFWEPMDTYRDYQHLNKMANSNNAPWIVW
jgi:glucose-1-phosphate cytidylyltransferase